MALFAFLMCVNFAACSSDDEPKIDDESGIVASEKKLVEIKHVDEDGDTSIISFNYDSKGRLIFKKGGVNGDTYYTWGANAIIAKHDWGAKTMNLNSKGNITNVEWDNASDVFFTYDFVNQLVSFEAEWGITNFHWENGKIYKSTFDYGYDEIETTYTYEKSTCKGYFPLYSTYYLDTDSYEISLAHPELLGLRCSQLPNRIIEKKDDREKIIEFYYMLDNLGYVESCTTKEIYVESGSKNTYTTVWFFKWQ